jgi:uncharacterized C2H2 Zn-finger protein
MPRQKQLLALPPFEGYSVVKPFFHKKEGRFYIRLTAIEPGLTSFTTSYARYLYCVFHNIKLSKEVQIDHIDEDRTHDRVGNLKAVSQLDNLYKNKRYRGCQREVVELKCPWCDTVFHREKRQTHISKGGVFTSCSRKCGGAIRQSLQQQAKTGITDEALNARIASNFIKIVQEGIGSRIGEKRPPSMDIEPIEDFSISVPLTGHY